jgi:gamma-glutamyltranspeptidase/glutathione hydrolase
VMGGPMQAQGHVQMALRVLAYAQNPQTAADAPRWRILAGRRVAVEPSMPEGLMLGLRGLGHDVVMDALDSQFAFGGAQLIVKGAEGSYVAGSDPRKDGQAVVY